MQGRTTHGACERMPSVVGRRWSISTTEMPQRGLGEAIGRSCGRIVGKWELDLSDNFSGGRRSGTRVLKQRISRTKNPLKPLRNLVLKSVEEKRGCF